MSIEQINPVPMFHTPKDIIEVQDWIEKHLPEERAHLYTASMMVWNLMCGYHNDHVGMLQEELTDKLSTMYLYKQIIEMQLVQLQDYSENELVNGDGTSMTIDQIKEAIK